MSFINKPGKTSAVRQMIIRQQVSDVIAYGKIITTHTKAKESQKHVDKIITLAKQNDLAAKRKAASILLANSKFSAEELLTKLFTVVGPKYKTRNGGYTRVLKLGMRPGDATEEAILELV